MALMWFLNDAVGKGNSVALKAFRNNQNLKVGNSAMPTLSILTDLQKPSSISDTTNLLCIWDLSDLPIPN